MAAGAPAGAVNNSICAVRIVDSLMIDLRGFVLLRALSLSPREHISARRYPLFVMAGLDPATQPRRVCAAKKSSSRANTPLPSAIRRFAPADTFPRAARGEGECLGF